MRVLDVDFDNRQVEYHAPKQIGVGRELFMAFRHQVTPADEGALSINWEE